MKRTPKRAFRLVTALAVTALLSSCATTGMSQMLFDQAVARKSKQFLQNDKDLPPGPSLARSFDGSWFKAQATERIAIRSADGIDLVAHYLPARGDSGRLVILAHGYTANGWTMSAYAQFYHEELGYGVLAPDARGHGESGGDYIGYGWPERRDYLQWIRLMLERLGPETRIVLHGVSMGGATVLMASGEPDLPPQVKAIVEDCGYTSVDDELSYQLKRMYGKEREPFIPEASRLAKSRVGYSFEEASALEQVRKSRTPTLFIHGGSDAFVPTEMVHRLYDACAAEKGIWVVPGAGHAVSFSVDREGYVSRVRSFLERYVGG